MTDSSPAPPQWRPMSAADLNPVHGLSARVHPDFPERPEVLAEKFRLFPRGCFVLGNPGRDGGSGVLGYCFSHPWRSGPPPALDTMLQTLPGDPDVYFLHDLALDASTRGRNFGTRLLPSLIEAARSVPVQRMILVAVSGSAPFWTRMGFRPTTDAQLQTAAREKYGAGAMQMERDLSAGATA